MCPEKTGHGILLERGSHHEKARRHCGVPEEVLYSWGQKHLDELEVNAPEGPQSPKDIRPIHIHLQEQGLECGRNRTLRLMKELQIDGTQKKAFKPLDTNSKHDFAYSPNLLSKINKPKGCD